MLLLCHDGSRVLLHGGCMPLISRPHPWEWEWCRLTLLREGNCPQMIVRYLRGRVLRFSEAAAGAFDCGLMSRRLNNNGVVQTKRLFCNTLPPVRLESHASITVEILLFLSAAYSGEMREWSGCVVWLRRLWLWVKAFFFLGNNNAKHWRWHLFCACHLQARPADNSIQCLNICAHQHFDHINSKLVNASCATHTVWPRDTSPPVLPRPHQYPGSHKSPLGYCGSPVLYGKSLDCSVHGYQSLVKVLSQHEQSQLLSNKQLSRFITTSI